MDAKRIGLIAILVGLLTTFLVYKQVQPILAPPAEEPVKKVTVVVAIMEIAPNATIAPSALRLQEYPEDYPLPNDVFSEADQVVGRVARYLILPGEPIRNGRLVEEAKRAGLAYLLPEGHRAISLRVNDVSGVSGLIQPGDKVDVLATVNDPELGSPTTITVLQDVLVLAIAQDTQVDPEKKPTLATSVTLAVLPGDAEKLTLAAETGSLYLSLRGFSQLEQQQPPGWELGELVTTGHPNRTNLVPEDPATPKTVTVIRGSVSYEELVTEP